jgi:P27 family predicted phage terminase small subunit
LHKLHGTYNVTDHRRRNYEPQSEAELSSEPPHWLTDEQQASWRYALAHAPCGLLKSFDRGALVIWCAAEARHRDAVMAQQRLDAGREWPMLQPGKDGRPQISPYIKIVERSALITLRAAEALGFTPASRRRIQLICTVTCHRRRGRVGSVGGAWPAARPESVPGTLRLGTVRD